MVNQWGAFRLNGGDVECLSSTIEGQDCKWWRDSDAQCKQFLKTQASLTCGEEHKNRYGTTGYEHSSNWCSKARSQLNGSTKWRCTFFTDQYALVRMNGNDAECLSSSERGDDCYWWTEMHSNRFFLNLEAQETLTCGEEHKKYWGTTGYDNSGHWCSKAASILGR